MRQQLLDRDVVVDQRQVIAEQRSRARVQRECAVGDEADDDERRQRLGAAGDAELRRLRIRNAVRAMRQAIRASNGLAVAIDPHHAREPRLGRRTVDRFSQLAQSALKES
jgi:hypothetical protein